MNRQSNIELLRIIAMIMVVMVHVNFFSIGEPSVEDIYRDPLSSFSRYFFQSLTIGCVNTFVLVSGWFGIKLSIKSLSKFLFQIIFFLLLVYFIGLISGYVSFSPMLFFSYLLQLDNDWFSKTYILLMLMAPALNSFVENASQKQYKWILIGLFSIQTLYGWYESWACKSFSGGYSVMSFILLYLLARYMKIYPNKLSSHKKCIDFVLFASSVLLIATLSLYGNVKGNGLNGLMFSYINPLVIFSSMHLLFFFSKIEFNSSLVNKIAGSCYAVYLLHMNYYVVGFFKTAACDLYSNYSGSSYFLSISLLVVSVFFIAIFLDIPRRLFWRKVKPIFR